MYLIRRIQDYLNATQQFSTSSQSNYEAFMETFPFYSNLTERCSTLKIFGLYLERSKTFASTPLVHRAHVGDLKNVQRRKSKKKDRSIHQMGYTVPGKSNFLTKKGNQQRGLLQLSKDWLLEPV